MDKTRLFQFLSTQDPSVVLDLLSEAYDEMNYDQRQAVFWRISQTLPPASVDGEVLLEEVEDFRRESLAGVYYEPFDINSKNWMYVPEETKEWFERLGDLLQASAQLTAQGDHLHAVACFGTLYELIDVMESGEEVVFGDEIGSWMIPGDEKQYIASYMTSLAATATPEEFAAAALPLIRRDSWRSFTTQAYPSAIGAANEAQKAHLEVEIQRQKIRTGQESSGDATELLLAERPSVLLMRGMPLDHDSRRLVSCTVLLAVGPPASWPAARTGCSPHLRRRCPIRVRTGQPRSRQAGRSHGSDEQVEKEE